MSSANYPEIRSLEEIQVRFKVEIRVVANDFLAGNESYPAVVFSLGKDTFKLYVDDEYSDLQVGNPLLSLCVVLRELENYKDEKDYQSWCKSQLLNPADLQVKKYYKSLESLYKDVENRLGKIDSQVSNFEFELNSGAAQRLRKSS